MEIKICGITKEEEASYINEAMPEYVGFVFYEKSKRAVSLEQAVSIAAKLSPDIKKVAVMVSPEAALVQEIQQAGFDILQIHKELSKEVLEEAALPIWYAFNVSEEKELEEKQRFLHQLPERYSKKIVGIVVDAANFGSGKTFDWEKSKQKAWKKNPIFMHRRFILAGGLTAENVCEGIAAFAPDVVDVSSGVEGCHGKDKQKIIEFTGKVRNHE